VRGRRLPPDLALITAVLVIGAFATTWSTTFLTTDNLLELVRDSSIDFIIACPLALLVIAGGLDFSVGAVYAVGGVVAGDLMAHNVWWPVAIVLSVVTGLGIGVLSGLLVEYAHIPPFISTLAVFFVATGMTVLLVSGLVTTLPNGFVDIGQASLFGIPVLGWYALVAGLVTALVLERTRFGYSLRALGGNRSAARAAGINVRGTTVLMYGASAAAAALGGVLFTARTSAAQGTSGGYSLTLQVLTIVLVGGVSLAGGTGSIGGVALGAVLVGEIQNAIYALDIDPGYANVLIGVALAFAVGFDAFSRRRRFNTTDAPTGSSTSVARNELARVIQTRQEVERARVLAAVNSERKRIERDLHDGAQQGLVNAALMIDMAAREVRKSDDERASTLLDQGLAALREAMADVRGLSRGLYPTQLGASGLRSTIEALFIRSSIPVTINATEVPRLAPEVELAAYFVVAEAFANVLKYARAQEVTVDLGADETTLFVKVTDDGTGLANEGGGSGLRGLRDRVESAGGTFLLDSRPGIGTTVSASFPVLVRENA
jgi:ribose transport system permease protein